MFFKICDKRFSSLGMSVKKSQKTDIIKQKEENMSRTQTFRMMAIIFVVSLGWVSMFASDGMCESFPNRPVTIIVPFSAGGSTDVLVRSLSKVAEKKLGVPLIITNKTGAGGTVGQTELARSKNDGYTIGSLAIGASTVVPQIRKVHYNIETDFEFIGGISAFTYGIFVKSDSRFNSMADVIKEARANPGKITYGTMSPYVQMALLLVEQKENIKMTYVPFRSGSKATAGLLGGHIDIAIISTDAVKFLESKDIKMLASAAPERWELVPDVPTMKELGYDVDVTSWAAIGAPAGVDKAKLEIFNAAFKEAHSDPEVMAFFKKRNAYVPYRSGPEIRKFFLMKKEEIKPFVEIIKAGLKKK